MIKHHRVMLYGLSFVAVSILMLVYPLCAQTTTEPKPADFVSRLLTAVDQRSQGEIEALVTTLQGMKDEAVPAVEEALPRANDQQRVQLVRVLSGIGIDSSTSLLVKIAADKAYPLSAARAFASLENRTVRRELTPEELQAFQDKVRDGSDIGAGTAATVLAKCVEVPAADRLQPIIDRFKFAVVSPGPESQILGGYLSPRVSMLNRYLLAFSYIGEPAIPALKQRREASPENSDARRWWTLALGFSGDSSVKGELADMVAAEPDPSTRSMAVRAYARSAKQEAIALLESLLSDETVSEYRGCIAGEKFYIIRSVASDELVNLRRQAATQ